MKSSKRSHKKVRGKRKELGSSLHTCQGYDTQMLLMHGLSYGPALILAFKFPAVTQFADILLNNRSTETCLYLAKNENIYAISDRHKIFQNINIFAHFARHCGPHSSSIKLIILNPQLA